MLEIISPKEISITFKKKKKNITKQKDNIKIALECFGLLQQLKFNFPIPPYLLSLKSISSSKIIKHASIGPYFKLKITFFLKLLMSYFLTILNP